jgi:hypothetical protein
MGRASFDFDVISGPTPPRRAETSVEADPPVSSHDPGARQSTETLREAQSDVQATAETGP